MFHLDNIRMIHRPQWYPRLRVILLICFMNKKCIQHNLQRLTTMNSVDNPTAIIQTKGSGKKFSKGVNCHFQGETPKTSLLCIRAAVSIQGFNFCPLWGVHNGVCVTVCEIIFKPGKTPTCGHQPNYFVVNFPMYIGPPWGSANPKYKVQYTMLHFLTLF